MTACTRRITTGAATSPPFRFRLPQPRAIKLHHLPPSSLVSQRQNLTLGYLPSHPRQRFYYILGTVNHYGGGERVSIQSDLNDDGEDERNSEAHSSSIIDGDVTFREGEENISSNSSSSSSSGGGVGDSKAANILIAAAATVVLGVGNRVLHKLALVPLKQYPFFLAQLATFGYVLVYFTILHFRHRAGVVTDEMLSLPKAPFMGVGILEALAAAAGMAAATVLSGASIPILSQTFLVWQLLLSVIFLGRRYSVNQLIGCFLVSVGVVVTVASGSSANMPLKGGDLFWSLLMIFSFFLQAADTILKEVIFLDAAQRLKGGSVDLFVVNSYGSAYQAMFICVLLPFLSKLWGIPFGQLPSYLKDGAACFLNLGSLSTGCDGAPLLPVLFVIVNMSFNISLLHLLKISSAVISCLASTISVPLSVFIFTLPLPYLGSGSALPPGFVAGVIVLVMGLLFYAWRPTVTPDKVAVP